MRLKLVSPVVAILLIDFCMICTAADETKTGARLPVVVFPGTEGFGALASGGRGGAIYHVSNLNDHGPARSATRLAGSGGSSSSTWADTSTWLHRSASPAISPSPARPHRRGYLSEELHRLIRQVAQRHRPLYPPATGPTSKQDKKCADRPWRVPRRDPRSRVDRVGSLGLHRLHRLDRSRCNIA